MKNGKSSTMRKVLIVVNVIALLGFGAATGYLFFENRDLNDQINLTSEEKNKRLVEEIKKVFDLPNEEPIVAVVTDVDEFKKQYPTFDNAASGDYLLFYRKARLNILYRQSEKKVVKTANVTVPVTIELVGSEAAIAAAEKSLAEFGSQITLTKTVKEGITQAFVFDVDNDQKAEADSIAKLLNIEIGSTLPSSITPEAATEIIISVVVQESTPSTPTSNPDTAP